MSTRTIAIELQVDGGDSVQQTEKVEQSLTELNQTYTELNKDVVTGNSKAEQSFKKLNKQIENGELDAQQLRKAIKDYQTIAIQAGRTSPIGQEALKKAAGLHDLLTDLDNEIKAIAHDGANMQAALQLGSSVVAGYTAFQSVTALLGVENEELMKTMVKLQAAQGLLMSIEQIRASLEKQTTLVIKAKTAGTWLLTAATTAYNIVVGTSTGLLKAFRVALALTGVGALILGVVALVQNFEKLTEWLGFSTEATEENTEAIQENKEAVDQWNQTLDEAVGKIEKQTNRKIAAIQREIDRRRLAGKETMDLEKQILQVQKDSLLEQEKESIKAAKLKARASAKSEKELNEDIFNIQLDFAEKRVALNHKIKMAVAENNKKAREEEAEEYKKFNDENLKAVEDGIIKAQELREKLSEDIEFDLPTDLEDEEQVFVARFDIEEVLSPIEQFYIRWKLLDKEAKIEMAQNGVNLATDMVNNMGKLTDVLNANSQRRLDQENLTADETEKINKRIFNRNKLLQGAQVVVDGAAAAVKALTAATMPQRIAGLTMATTTTLLALRNIAKTQYGAGIPAPTDYRSAANSGGDNSGGNQTRESGGEITVNSTISITELEAVGTRVSELEDFSTTG